MKTPEARTLFKAMEDRWPLDEYNFKHFRLEHLLFDGWQLLTKGGLRPGDMAPDWEMPRAFGGTLRLSDLRGKPVLLRFGSWS